MLDHWHRSPTKKSSHKGTSSGQIKKYQNLRLSVGTHYSAQASNQTGH
uniref:Uncharacterized protein n=1 Tax=Arundo donax TaxID=35708 RepID=A0A0A9GUB4_ARUDO